jgi:hypothetical protein
LRRTVTTALLSGLVLLMACGRKPNASGIPAVTIELSSNSQGIPLQAGSSATVTATIYDQGDQGVMWTMTPLNFGTLSKQTATNQPPSSQTAAITYTAPKNVGAPTTVTITATSITNPFVTSSLSFSIVPLSVTLSLINNFGDYYPASTQAMAQGQELSLNGVVITGPGVTDPAGVSWSLSPPNTGSLLNSTTNSVTYVAPMLSPSDPTPASLSVIATSVTNPSVTTSLNITVFQSGGGLNVVPVSVNGGPIAGQVHANSAFTSITLCNPGSFAGQSPPDNAPACQAVDGVLVDTGSYGLRVLQSQIPLLKLPTISDGSGDILEN